MKFFRTSNEGSKWESRHYFIFDERKLLFDGLAMRAPGKNLKPGRSRYTFKKSEKNNRGDAWHCYLQGMKAKWRKDDKFQTDWLIDAVGGGGKCRTTMTYNLKYGTWRKESWIGQVQGADYGEVGRFKIWNASN